MRRRGWRRKLLDFQVVFLVALVWAVGVEAGGPVRCTTYEEKTMGRLQTLCDDGTRAVSTYNRTMDRWDTTITESPRKACTGHLNPLTRRVEVRCR